MFSVKIFNKENESDIVFNKEYEVRENAFTHYNQYTTIACSDRRRLIREANEELHQTALRYCDVVIQMLEEDVVKHEFMIGE